MPISHNFRFIFVHVPKCAGTSLQKALAVSGAEMDLQGVANMQQRLAYNEFWLHHLPASKISAIVGKEIWQSYYKFSFVRNPWERLVSFYHFRLRKPEPLTMFKPASISECARHPRYTLWYTYALCRQRFIAKVLRKNSVPDTFEKFLHRFLSDKKRCSAFSASRFLMSDNGEPLVDFIGRYENLDEDFRKICRRVGINASIPLLNQSIHGDYRKYYSQKFIDRVAETFKADIANFKYEF